MRTTVSPEVVFEAFVELLRRVRVTLSAEVLERVSRRYAAKLRAPNIISTICHSLEKPTPERIPYAGRIDDAMRRKRVHIVTT